MPERDPTISANPDLDEETKSNLLKRYSILHNKSAQELTRREFDEMDEIASKLGGHEKVVFAIEADIKETPEAESKETEKSGGLIEGYVPGRAEYESIEGRKVFEDKSPQEIYPWIFERKFGVGMIIAPRGSGKTFLVRQIMKEIPVELNLPDKSTLDYAAISADQPEAIIVDDLHYVLELKRLEELNEVEPRISDKEVLDFIEKKINEAREKNIPIVFVATGRPMDLYDRFAKKEDQDRFLNLMGGVYEANMLFFRERLSKQEFLNMRRELGMADLPIFQTSEMGHNSSQAHLVFPDDEIDGRIHKDINEPKGKRNLFRHTTGSLLNEDEYNLRTTFLIGSKKGHPLRRLMTVAQELGGITRETIGVPDDLGVRSDQIFYGIPVEGEESIEATVTPNRLVIIELFRKFLAKYEISTKLYESIQEGEQQSRKDLWRGFCMRELEEEVERVGGGLSQEELEDLKKKKAAKYYSAIKEVEEEYDPRLHQNLKLGDVFYKKATNVVKGYKRTNNRVAPGGWLYTANEIHQIDNNIEDIANEILGNDPYLSLAKKLGTLGEEADAKSVEKAFLEHSMNQELP